MAVLTLDFMSSEESNDDSDDELEDTYIVRELPWRSSKVDVFIQLDEETKRSMSKQSKRQQKKRIYSEEPSSRPIPSGKFSSWAVATPAATNNIMDSHYHNTSRQINILKTGDWC